MKYNMFQTKNKNRKVTQDRREESLTAYCNYLPKGTSETTDPPNSGLRTPNTEHRTFAEDSGRAEDTADRRH
jgi:hypothetical protein